MNKGKLVLLPAKNLKEEDYVIYNKLFAKIYKKSSDGQFIMIYNSVDGTGNVLISELQQFHIEYHVDYLGNIVDAKHIHEYQEHVIPLSFSDYSKALELKDGAEVEFREVLINPMGREIHQPNISMNTSQCKWFANLITKESFDIPEREESWADIWSDFLVSEKTYRITMFKWLEDNYHPPKRK